MTDNKNKGTQKSDIRAQYNKENKTEETTGFSDLYLFKIGIGMRSSLIIVCINSVFPFISFPFSVGLALTGFFFKYLYAFCVK